MSLSGAVGAGQASWREAQRARILLRYHDGESVSHIARAVHMTRKSVGKWIGKALAVGATAALKDTYHRPKERSINCICSIETTY